MPDTYYFSRSAFNFRIGRKLFLLLVTLCICYNAGAQIVLNGSAIREIRWSGNYDLYLFLSDDSTIILSTRHLPHARELLHENQQEKFTFLPAHLDNGYVQFLQKQAGNSSVRDSFRRGLTLWGSLHDYIGGGYVHFIHCLQYALESGYLNLESPLMKRPETKWRPKPATETWKRTRKWKYYVPDNQKYAIKEYRLRQQEGKADILAGIPDEMINSFLKTSNRDYKKLETQNAYREKARIDLIRLLLGSPYLGEVQISYIRTMVMKAITQYSVFRLPAIIIVDEFNAAVVMSLDERGYRVDQVVFSDESSVSAETRVARIRAIEEFTAAINSRNNQVFENKLKQYFAK